MTTSPDPTTPTDPAPGSARSADAPGSSAPRTEAGGTGSTSPSKPAQKSATPTPPKKKPADDPLRGSRTSGTWVALGAFSIVLVLLIIFIAQNTQSASVSFLAWEGTAPVSVLLLVAATAGLMLAGVAATARILQLRRRVKRERKA